MKKFLSMVLLTVMCITMLMGSAQADWLSDFIGYWEVQNVAVGGYTVGGNYLGFEMTAVVHKDGVFILTMDNEMLAGYISGYGDKYYIDDGTGVLDLTFDTQGRMHVTFNGEEPKIDVRMRKAKANRVSGRMANYVGDWKLLDEEVDLYGETTMSLYNDGFGVVTMKDGLMAVRLGMQGGKVCIVDNEGKMMPVTHESDDVIVFTIVNTEEDYEMTLRMERVN